MQDSARDWERESALMGLIYSKSRVTLAATSSASSHHRCFNVQTIGQTNGNSRIIEVPNELPNRQRSVLNVYEWSSDQTQEDQESPHLIWNGSLSARG